VRERLVAVDFHAWIIRSGYAFHLSYLKMKLASLPL